MKLVLHVFKVFTQDRDQQLFVEFIPLFSLMILSWDWVHQRLVVLTIMVMALFQERVPQRLVEQIFACTRLLPRGPVAWTRVRLWRWVHLRALMG